MKLVQPFAVRGDSANRRLSERLLAFLKANKGAFEDAGFVWTGDGKPVRMRTPWSSPRTIASFSCPTSACIPENNTCWPTECQAAYTEFSSNGNTLIQLSRSLLVLDIDNEHSLR